MRSLLLVAIACDALACRSSRGVEGVPSVDAASHATDGVDSTTAPVASTPPPDAGAPPVRVPIPTYAGGPGSAALCAAFLAKARAYDATLPSVGDVGGGGFDAKMLDDACYPTPGGAWALAFGAVTATSTMRDGHAVRDSARGSWRVFHLTPNGAQAEAPPAPFDANEVHSFAIEHLLFDYDGDGEPELLLHVQTSEHSESGIADEQVWTQHGGGVKRYPPAAAIAATFERDVDGDGRPDLLYTGEPRGRVEGQSSPTHTTIPEGLLLAAHSLPDGTFSTSDAAAAGCVRATSADLTQRRPNASFNYDLMMTWADYTPPLTLTAVATP
jgi:hypothetical protein